MTDMRHHELDGLRHHKLDETSVIMNLTDMRHPKSNSGSNLIII
jgi:hypothetical protein